MRIIISTQGLLSYIPLPAWKFTCGSEPTVVPSVVLDLCSVAILHRFASPKWWEHISQHVSARLSSEDAFNHVVTLQVSSIASVSLHC